MKITILRQTGQPIDFSKHPQTDCVEFLKSVVKSITNTGTSVVLVLQTDKTMVIAEIAFRWVEFTEMRYSVGNGKVVTSFCVKTIFDYPKDAWTIVEHRKSFNTLQL